MHGVAIEEQAALMDSPIRLIDPDEPLPEKELATNTAHAIENAEIFFCTRGKVSAAFSC